MAEKTYFVLKRPKIKDKEIILGRVFIKGVHVVENDLEAEKLSAVLCKYYAVEMTKTDPKAKVEPPKPDK